MTSSYVCPGVYRLVLLLLITALFNTDVLLAGSEEPATPPKEKAGMRTGTVIAIDTNKATFTLRPRVVGRGYNVDEATVPKYIISCDSTTKFVHVKNGEVTIADLATNDFARVSVFESNQLLRAVHVMLGLPNPGMGPRPMKGFTTNTTPLAVSTNKPAGRP